MYGQDKFGEFSKEKAEKERIPRNWDNELFCKIMDDIQTEIIKEQVTKVIDSMINDITINLIF